MDPHRYCHQAVTELLAESADSRVNREDLQRAAVLAYLAQLRLSDPDFMRVLHELASGLHGRPGVTAAARAILHDWQGNGQDH